MNPTTADSTGGLLRTFLTNPAALFTPALDAGTAFLTTAWPWIAPTAVIGVGGVLGLRRIVHRRRQRALTQGAHLVTVLAPPTVPERGGQVLWAQLSGLLRPWYQRLLHGQPHLAFEYAWTSDGLTVRV